MKILIYGINFYPELTGIGKYSGELSNWLSQHGHEVRVVTAPPYYPAWKITEAYSTFKWSIELWGDCKIFRCPIWVPINPIGLKRLIHLASFALTSLPVIFSQVLWRPNLIWVVEPPLFVSPIAYLGAKLCGSKTVLHIQDYEIDAAFDLGIIKGKHLKKVALIVESFLMRRFDLVSTISRKMLERAKNKGVDISRLIFFPNWVEVSDFSSKSAFNARNDFRRKLRIPDNALIALYSGSMGAKQGLEIVSQVAHKFMGSCEDSPLIHFILCGDGPGRLQLINQCAELKYVHFLDFQPIEALPGLLLAADIHLLPQKMDIADLVMPSKLTGMLASGRPVLASAQPETELSDVVRRCGIVVPPENPHLFFEALLLLANDGELRERLGNAGRAYAKDFMDKDSVLSNYEKRLRELVS